ncbi:hypothetical protein TNCV_3024921 [Trichonephila clavipes]|nr:hypothetical protein TNCV_3024921 [Trichonephila clavipes]
MKKDAGRMGPSVSHGSETTARLERRAPTMRRERPHALRGRQTRDQRKGENKLGREAAPEALHKRKSCVLDFSFGKRFVRGRIVAYQKSGSSFRDITCCTDRNPTTVMRIWNQLVAESHTLNGMLDLHALP